MPAGYSPTPLFKKLGVRPGGLVLLVDSPGPWDIPQLPAGARVVRVAGLPDPSLASGPARHDPERADVVVAFQRELAALRRDVAALSRAIVVDGSLWLAWPRRAAGHSSDITDNAVRECSLPLGLVDVKVAALDEDWSGLKMMWRRELRAGLA